MDNLDTICALATGTTGAVSIVRIDGANALKIGRMVWSGKGQLNYENRRKMQLGKVGGDQALAVYFCAPNSYTGNDIVELQCHGGVRAGRAVMEAVLSVGARMAEPGEFTFRAFINGKIDLVQAEAVGDLVTAASAGALHMAERQLEGVLSQRFAKIREELVYCLSECEAHLDFPDEELDWDDKLLDKVQNCAEEIANLCSGMDAGAVWREGTRVAIAGRPNAGKSSLLNRLLGFDRSIVTEIAGTTRDTVEEITVLRGIPVILADTAGLRESQDKIEMLGVDRSRRCISQAEIVLWVLDASSKELDKELQEMKSSLDKPTLALWNKIDVAGSVELPTLNVPAVKVSAATGEGIDGLLDWLIKTVTCADGTKEPEVAINARHHDLLLKAQEIIPEAMAGLVHGEFELAAIQIREVIRLLGRVTGETVEPDVLDDIFSRFCIGK